MVLSEGGLRQNEMRKRVLLWHGFSEKVAAFCFGVIIYDS